MKQRISWGQLLTVQADAMLDFYITFDQFSKNIEELLQHDLCPLAGLQYVIECPTPFQSFEVGRSSTGEPDVSSFDVKDNRGTLVRIKKWNKRQPVSKPNNTDTLLKELFVNFWKPDLRTKSAGMLDLKRDSRAVALAQGTLELHLEAGQTCAILFSDLDNFKDVNDTFSYEEGNRIIREYGALLEELAGNEAIMLHNGGDEFIILRPDSTGEEAVMLAHRISTAIEVHDFKVKGITIGVSTGLEVVCPGTNLMTFSELLAEAGQALKHTKEAKKGRARFLPGTTAKSETLKTDYRLDLAQCIVKSNLLLQCPFANIWLNCLSQVTCCIVKGKHLELDEIFKTFDSFIKWIDVDIVGISETRSILSSGGRSDSTACLSPIDMAFALAHGLLRGAIVRHVEGLHDCSLLIKYDAKGQNCAVYIKRESKQELVWEFGGKEKLTQEYDIGSFWTSQLEPSEELSQSARAMLIQIGHQSVGLPNSIFAERIIVDDRPTRGGGLPDFWELTVAKVTTQTLRNPNINAVYVFGNHEYGAKTVEKLSNVSDWSENLTTIAYKTALQENNIRDVSSRLQGRIYFVGDKKGLVSNMAGLLRSGHSLLPMCQIPASLKSRFLQRELNMRKMGLTSKDGCRVSTIAEAYPLVLEIARKTIDETVIIDQAGQELRELVDFKVYLEYPERNMVPAFYEQDKDSLEEYYERVFQAQKGFFGDIFRESGQFDAVLNHVTDIISNPQVQFATRRAILIVPHKIRGQNDISPLGLVSVRIIPRFTANRVNLNYSYTWRTVEALVGFPYSLYGSVRFGQYLTEELKGLVQHDVARRIHMGFVSYIANSLHFFVDEHGQNIARRIIDDASI